MIKLILEILLTFSKNSKLMINCNLQFVSYFQPNLYNVFIFWSYTFLKEIISSKNKTNLFSWFKIFSDKKLVFELMNYTCLEYLKYKIQLNLYITMNLDITIIFVGPGRFSIFFMLNFSRYNDIKTLGELRFND